MMDFIKLNSVSIFQETIYSESLNFDFIMEHSGLQKQNF